jgi:hypothetical protein
VLADSVPYLRTSYLLLPPTTLLQHATPYLQGCRQQTRTSTFPPLQGPFQLSPRHSHPRSRKALIDSASAYVELTMLPLHRVGCPSTWSHRRAYCMYVYTTSRRMDVWKVCMSGWMCVSMYVCMDVGLKVNMHVCTELHATCRPGTSSPCQSQITQKNKNNDHRDQRKGPQPLS